MYRELNFEHNVYYTKGVLSTRANRQAATCILLPTKHIFKTSKSNEQEKSVLHVHEYSCFIEFSKQVGEKR